MEGLTKRQIIAPGGGAGLKLARGEHLRLIDIEGGQTGDLMAFASDGRERLSNGRSFDYNGKILQRATTARRARSLSRRENGAESQARCALSASSSWLIWNRSTADIS